MKSLCLDVNPCIHNDFRACDALSQNCFHSGPSGTFSCRCKNGYVPEDEPDLDGNDVCLGNTSFLFSTKIVELSTEGPTDCRLLVCRPHTASETRLGELEHSFSRFTYRRGNCFSDCRPGFDPNHNCLCYTEERLEELCEETCGDSRCITHCNIVECQCRDGTILDDRGICISKFEVRLPVSLSEFNIFLKFQM